MAAFGFMDLLPGIDSFMLIPVLVKGLMAVVLLQFLVSVSRKLWCEETRGSFCCPYSYNGSVVCVDVW